MKKTEIAFEKQNPLEASARKTITETRDKDGRLIRRRVSYETHPVSLAQQQYKNDADINHIMQQYNKTGTHEAVRRLPVWGADLTTDIDYQTSLNRVLDANEAFENLPAHIRKEFDNDPINLLKFVHDEKNYDKAAELGLIDPAIISSKKDSQNFNSLIKNLNDFTSLQSSKKPTNDSNDKA